MIKFYAIISKRLLLITIFFYNYQIVYSQNNVLNFEDSIIKEFQAEGMTMKLGIDVLVYIHFQTVEEVDRPKCALFYFNENGMHKVKTSNFWDFNNSSKIVLNSVPRYSSCKLEQELKFNKLDLDWLKGQLLINCKKSQANFVYFDVIDRIGYLRTYQLFSN